MPVSRSAFRAIEKHNLGGVTKFSQEWVDKIKAELEKQNLTEYLELANLIGTMPYRLTFLS